MNSVFSGCIFNLFISSTLRGFVIPPGISFYENVTSVSSAYMLALANLRHSSKSCTAMGLDRSPGVFHK